MFALCPLSRRKTVPSATEDTEHDPEGIQWKDDRKSADWDDGHEQRM